MSRKTAIVIGATGLVGSELVSLLAQADYIEKVITITRREIKYESSRVENHVVDFDRLAEFSAVFKGDLLFSCLGTTAKVAGSIQAQRVVDLEYQSQAATLAAEQGVSHYLLVSSSGANSKSLSPYLKMKGELEDRIKALPFKHISIFQPSLLLGERGAARFAEDLGSKVLPLLCKLPGLRRYRPIHARQVAAKMVSSAAQPSSDIETFTLDDVFSN